MSKRGEVRLCSCGCGLPASVYRSEKGLNKGWRLYATGHAPNERVDVRAPSDPVSLAYAAGIVDGEGCIYARFSQRPSGNSTVLSLSVTMCSASVIEWLGEQFGGEVYVSAPPSAKRRERFHWQVRGSKTAILLRALLPYLREKKCRAVLGIELAELLTGNRFQPLSTQQCDLRISIANRIKAFNRHHRSEEFELTGS